jgi:subtilisin family serine protease
MNWVCRRCIFIALLSIFPLFISQQTKAEEKSVLVRHGQEILVTVPKKEKLHRVSSSYISNSHNENKKHYILSLDENSSIKNASINTQKISKAKITRFCRRFLKNNPSATCEPNTILQQKLSADDTFYSRMYGLQQISAPTAWDTTTGSSSVKVAVIDTGIDYTHPDLSGNVSHNDSEIPDNNLDDDNNGYIDDYYGFDFTQNVGDPMDQNSHGSHVSGTIGATSNNTTGVTGINWSVGLIGVRVLDADGFGSLSDIARGVDYAVTRGAHVINMSIGASENSRALRESIKKAKYADVLVVVAAGNESNNNDSVFSFPADYNISNLISVAASDSSDEIANFSNYGKSSVHLAAPGVGILSTVLGGYDSYDGTSMASPHVAGVAALVKSAYPDLHAQDLKDAILNGADLINNHTGYTITGGRLNAQGALSYAATASPQTLPSQTSNEVSIQITKKSKTRSSKIKISGNISDTEGAMPGEDLDLVCSKKIKGSATSDISGNFKFSVKRGTKRMRCYIEDSNNQKSGKFAV